MWNLLLVVRGFTEVPLSQAYGLPAQHKARPSGALSGELPRSIIRPQIFASRNPAEGNGQLLPPFPLGDGLTAARS